MVKNLKNFIYIIHLIQLVGVFLILGCSTTISKEPPIIFSSNQNGNFDIFSIDSDGQNLQAITDDLEDEFSPKVSSDSSYIVFLKNFNGIQSIYLLNNNDLGGKNYVDLFVGGPYNLSSQIWSPDGEKIVYASESGPSIYVMGIDESEPLKLTSIPGYEVGDWSIDGKSIFFSSDIEGIQGIYVRNPDGVNENRLIDFNAFSPKLSPDGEKLIFLSNQGDFTGLYIADYDDENFSLKPIEINSQWYKKVFGNSDHSETTDYKRIELPDDISRISNISWGPKSEKILFVSGVGEDSEIYVVNIKKNNKVVRLTRNNVRDDQPVWSPNGRKIAFVSYLDGDSEIFVMRPDGTEQNRVTNNLYDDYDPDW